MCDGDGEMRVVIRDTTKIRNHPLFAGINETAHGVEIKLHDKMDALDKIARIICAYSKDNAQRYSGDGLKESARCSRSASRQISLVDSSISFRLGRSACRTISIGIANSASSAQG